MESLYLILIEIGIFLALAYGYYVYQKRKILRLDLEENFSLIEDLLQKHSSEIEREPYQELMKNKQIKQILILLASDQSRMQDSEEELKEIFKNLNYHCKS